MPYGIIGLGNDREASEWLFESIDVWVMSLV